MDYMSAAQAAQKWGTGRRQVQRLLASGRIPNAQKLGNSWVVPVSAEKPPDPRLEKKQKPSAEFLSERLSAMCEAVYISQSLDNPYSVIDTLKDEKLRTVFTAHLSYLKGDFEQAKCCCKTTEGDEAAKLLISGTAIATAISSGDFAFYDEYETFLKAVIESNRGASVTSFAELQLAIGYVGAGLPEMAAGWIKDGDFTNVYPVVKCNAIRLRIEYFRWQKKYESMLAAAQTTLSLLESHHSQREFSSIEFELRTRCAIACHYLGRMDEAKRWLLGAMEIAFPHGFTVLFASIITDLGGLLERCMKQAYPEYYDKVIVQSRQIVNNWVAFHFRYLKGNTSLILTIREQTIANLAARRVPYAEIARRLGLSPGTIKNAIQVIYSKMNVNNRDELYAMLW